MLLKINALRFHLELFRVAIQVSSWKFNLEVFIVFLWLTQYKAYILTEILPNIFEPTLYLNTFDCCINVLKIYTMKSKESIVCYICSSKKSISCVLKAVFQWTPNPGVLIQQLDDVRKFQHWQYDVVLFTNSIPGCKNPT